MAQVAGLKKLKKIAYKRVPYQEWRANFFLALSHGPGQEEELKNIRVKNNATHYRVTP